MLAALELTQSPLLLELVISVYCRERVHVYHDCIQQTLTRYVNKYSSSNLALFLVEVIVGHTDSTDPAPTADGLSVWLVRRFGIPCWRACGIRSLTGTISDHY